MRRQAAIAGAVALGLAVLAGCTPDVPPAVTAPDAQETSAITQTQIDRIVPATFAELAAADEAADADLLGERVGGMVPRIRAAEYVKVEAGDDAALEEIPDTMQAVYVSAEGEFPRMMVGVTEAPEGNTPLVLLWLQDDIDSEYQLQNWAHMIPGATLPAMPGIAVGSDQLALDGAEVSPSPQQVVQDYVTLLQEGAKSDLADEFEDDTFREQLFAARKVLNTAAKKGDGKYVDTIEPDEDGTYALATADGGALVFAPLLVKSSLRVEGDATVSISDTDKALVKGKLTDRVTHTYRDLVVIHIPPADAEDAKPAVVAADHHLVKVEAK
ncbi:hypothetical protein [Demequina mangrovi]|uniref:DUF8094 domain-containing protein n=1 Tax=Demequina mangrovi TaxID=1043493 RepID=A0A1H6XE46_9MICO|nr:hypothetical protein [Demequina mangrovi]SEJ22815.1 hypothetical protein SAMN05421637_1235 [Demequina mangrovi]